MTEAAPIADVVLRDDSGSEVRLGDLWAERPVALVFLRHFGCIFCREHAAELNEHLDELEQAGGSVAAVGLGRPEHAADFRRLSGIGFPLLVSEDTSVHERMGLGRGNWLRVLGPQNTPGALRAALKGHRTKRTGADMSQLGGTFVIDPGGRVVFAHRARKASDEAAVPEIVAALREAHQG
jgi:peroxiredoxin